MSKELESLTKQRDAEAARIKTLEERRRHHALRGETFEAGRANQEKGLAHLKWTALDGRIREMTRSDEKTGYSSGSVFSGSNF